MTPMADVNFYVLYRHIFDIYNVDRHSLNEPKHNKITKL